MDENRIDNQNEIEKKPDTSSSFYTRSMAFCGYLLLMTTAAIILFIGFRYFNEYRGGFIVEKDKFSENQTVVSFVLQHYAQEVFLLLGALISGNFGLRLLFGANPNSAEIIPTKDRKLLEPLIESANKEAINQYVILSSLSGFTGTFQKIGFSGLPLATVTLTLIFSFLSFFNIEFMELAKLTLGAFIGSFVQKGQDQLNLAKEANREKI